MCIDWDAITAVSSAFSALATVAIAVITGFALKTWKTQAIETKRQELAKTLIEKVHEMSLFVAGIAQATTIPLKSSTEYKLINTIDYFSKNYLMIKEFTDLIAEADYLLNLEESNKYMQQTMLEMQKLWQDTIHLGRDLETGCYDNAEDCHFYNYLKKFISTGDASLFLDNLLKLEAACLSVIKDFYKS